MTLQSYRGRAPIHIGDPTTRGPSASGLPGGAPFAEQPMGVTARRMETIHAMPGELAALQEEVIGRE
jgi:hypothetical protein